MEREYLTDAQVTELTGLTHVPKLMIYYIEDRGIYCENQIDMWRSFFESAAKRHGITLLTTTEKGAKDYIINLKY